MKTCIAIIFILIPSFSFSQIKVKSTINTKNHQSVCLSYSSDGSYFVTSGLDNNIIIWETRSSSMVKKLTGLKSLPLSFAITSDNNYIVSGGKDKNITIWDFQSGKQVQVLKGHKKDITSISISNNNLIASASKDNAIIIWNLKSGQQLFKFSGHEKEVNSVSFNNNGTKLISGSADGTIKEWNIETGHLIRTINAHDGWVRCVSYSPTNNFIASGGDDCKLNIWNAITGDLQNSILAHTNWVQTLKFSPDGNYIASGGHDNYLILTEVKTGKVIFNSSKRENYILSVAFNPNGNELVSTALFSKQLTVWNISSLESNILPSEQIAVEKIKPEFKWITLNNAETNNLTYKIQFALKSNFNLDNIELYLNDKKFEDLTVNSTNNSWQNFEKVLFLDQGINKIKVSLYYDNDVISSKILNVKYSQPQDESIAITETLPQDESITTTETLISEVNENTNRDEISTSVSELSNLTFSNDVNPYRFALIIGNEDYNSYQVGLENEVNVDFAVNDATVFKEYAIKVFGIQKDNILFLTNARAIEMDNAIFKIRNIIKALNGKAEIIVYYAGHGFPDEKTKEPYLIPVDVTGTNLKFAVKLKDLYANLNEYPSKKITFFIDACFSGGARNLGLVSARGVKIKPKANQLSGNFIVMSASSANQSSLSYKEKHHGIFTYFLLQKLKETKGELTYKELSDFIVEQVGVKSAIINNKEQTPQINISPTVEEIWKDWKIK